MAKKEKALRGGTVEFRPEEEKLGIAVEGVNLAGSDVYKLMYICVDLLELCVKFEREDRSGRFVAGCSCA